MPKTTLIIVVVIVVILLLFAVVAGLQARNSQVKFRNEMAQRLDLEEKIIHLEKGHQDLQAELKASQEALGKAKLEADSLNEQLANIEKEKAVLSGSAQKPAEAKIASAP